MRPQPVGLAARHQPQPRPEVVQDQGGLRDHELAGLEKRRRVRRALAAVHHAAHGIDAVAAPPRDIDVVGPALLQRQADKLAAALDFRPVVKLVAHRIASASGNARQAYAAFATPPDGIPEPRAAMHAAPSPCYSYSGCPPQRRRANHRPPADIEPTRKPDVTAAPAAPNRPAPDPPARQERIPLAILYMVARRRDLLVLQRRVEAAGRDLSGRRGAVQPRVRFARAVLGLRAADRGLRRVPHPAARRARAALHVAVHLADAAADRVHA